MIITWLKALFTSCQFQPWPWQYHGPSWFCSFFPLLSAGLGLSLNNSLSDESVLGFELLGKVHCVVDEGESGGLATSEVGLEPEGEDSVGSAVLHLGELFPDVRLADGGLAGVEDVDDTM